MVLGYGGNSVVGMQRYWCGDGVVVIVVWCGGRGGHGGMVWW